MSYIPDKKLRWNGYEAEYLYFEDQQILSAFKGDTLVYELKYKEDILPGQTIFEAGLYYPYVYRYNGSQLDVSQPSAIMNRYSPYISTVNIPIDGIYQVRLVGGGGGYARTDASGGDDKQGFGNGAGGGGGIFNMQLTAGEYNIQIGNLGKSCDYDKTQTCLADAGKQTYIENVITARAGGGGYADGHHESNSRNGEGGSVIINESILLSSIMCQKGRAGTGGDCTVLSARTTLEMLVLSSDFNGIFGPDRDYTIVPGQKIKIGAQTTYRVQNNKDKTFENATLIYVSSHTKHAYMFGTPGQTAQCTAAACGGGYLSIKYLSSIS